MDVQVQAGSPGLRAWLLAQHHPPKIRGMKAARSPHCHRGGRSIAEGSQHPLGQSLTGRKETPRARPCNRFSTTKERSTSTQMGQREDQQDDEAVPEVGGINETLNTVIYIHILKYSNIYTYFAFAGKPECASSSSCPTRPRVPRSPGSPQHISHRAKL